MRLVSFNLLASRSSAPAMQKRTIVMARSIFQDRDPFFPILLWMSLILGFDPSRAILPNPIFHVRSFFSDPSLPQKSDPSFPILDPHFSISSLFLKRSSPGDLFSSSFSPRAGPSILRSSFSDPLSSIIRSSIGDPLLAILIRSSRKRSSKSRKRSSKSDPHHPSKSIPTFRSPSFIERAILFWRS